MVLMVLRKLILSSPRFADAGSGPAEGRVPPGPAAPSPRRPGPGRPGGAGGGSEARSRRRSHQQIQLLLYAIISVE